eukprot:g5735.t1
MIRNSHVTGFVSTRHSYLPLRFHHRLSNRSKFVVNSSSGSGSRQRKLSSDSVTADNDILTPLDLGEDLGPSLVNFRPLETWRTLPARYQLLMSIFAAFVTCNMDKVNMSVAIIPMAHEFGWNSTVAGLVQSAFFYGYLLCQLPGGYMSTRFSGSRMLPIGVGLWSAATFGLPIVGSSIAGLCSSRFLVGLGEALAPAAMADVLAKMIPFEERSRSVTFVNSGLYSGTILGLLTSPLLIEFFGWESVFYVFGGIGILWVLWWEHLVQQTGVTDVETYRKIKGISKSEEYRKRGDIPWRAMMRAQPVRALMYAHFCSAWHHYTLMSWLPSYFASTMGLGLGDAARISLLPSVAGIVVSTFAGTASDALISRGMSPGVVRKLCQCTAFIGPSLCLLGASLTDSNDLRIGLITSAIGLAGFCCSGLYCNSQDLSPKYAGFLLSLTSTFAAFPGIIGVPINGAILDATGSWPLALFAPAIFFNMTGAIVFGVFGRGEEIEFVDDKPFEFEENLNFKWIRSLLPFEA